MIPLRIYLKHFWQLWDSEIAYTVRIGFVILLAYGLVGSLDYADQKEQEAERHQQAKNHVEQAFLDCLNGRPVAQTDKAVVVCGKAWEVLK